MVLKKVGIGLLFSSLFLLSSCSYTARALYEYSLSDVESPDKTSFKKTAPYKVYLYDNEDVENPFIFEDDVIKIQFFPTNTSFPFKLENKTNETIKVIWDNGIFIDNNNASYRIINKLIKLSDEEKSSVPTPISKKSFLEDLIYPVGWASYRSGFVLYDRYIPGRWYLDPILPTYSVEASEEIHNKRLADIKEKFLNKSLKMVIPIEYKNKIREYIFSFKVEKVQIMKQN
jgi:hypothetical protein